jgi:hypothetical protein
VVARLLQHSILDAPSAAEQDESSTNDPCASSETRVSTAGSRSRSRSEDLSETNITVPSGDSLSLDTQPGEYSTINHYPKGPIPIKEQFGLKGTRHNKQSLCLSLDDVSDDDEDAETDAISDALKIT